MFGLIEGPVGIPVTLSQTISTAAGQAYTLTFWYRNVGAPNELLVSWDGAVVYDAIDVDDTPYVQVTVNLPPASSDMTDLTFGFRNDPDFFNFDDVVVQ